MQWNNFSGILHSLHFKRHNKFGLMKSEWPWIGLTEKYSWNWFKINSMLFTTALYLLTNMVRVMEGKAM